jgi:hypothetical protein
MTQLEQPDPRTREAIILESLTNRLLQAETRIATLEQSMLALMNRELNRPQFSPPSPSVYPAISPLAERSAPSYPSPAVSEEPDPNWAPVFHRAFPRGCGKIAQYLQHKMPATAVAQRSLLRVNARDGRGWHIPDEYEQATCSTCRVPIDPHSTRDLDWSQAIQRTPSTSLPRDVQDPVPDEDVRSAPLFDHTGQMITPEAEAERRVSLESAISLARALGYPADDSAKTP